MTGPPCCFCLRPRVSSVHKPGLAQRIRLDLQAAGQTSSLLLRDPGPRESPCWASSSPLQAVWRPLAKPTRSTVAEHGGGQLGQPVPTLCPRQVPLGSVLFQGQACRCSAGVSQFLGCYRTRCRAGWEGTVHPCACGQSTRPLRSRAVLGGGRLVQVQEGCELGSWGHVANDHKPGP